MKIYPNPKDDLLRPNGGFTSEEIQRGDHWLRCDVEMGNLKSAYYKRGWNDCVYEADISPGQICTEWAEKQIAKFKSDRTEPPLVLPDLGNGKDYYTGDCKKAAEEMPDREKASGGSLIMWFQMYWPVIKTALMSASPSEWQPIDENFYEKYGTERSDEMLFSNINEGWVIAGFYNGSLDWEEVAFYSSDFKCNDDKKDGIIDPTHYQPLPTPPNNHNREGA